MPKVKKIRSIFFTVLVLFLLCANVSAAETNHTTLNFKLTADGENEVTVDTGTVITVVYSLENASADENFTIQTVANEIYFDSRFFEYLGDSQIQKGDFTKTAKENVYSGGEHRIYFNGFHLNGQEYASGQFMGSFKLKVKATSGSSVISSKAMSAYEQGVTKYNLTSTDLTVTVGNAPSELYTVRYENNGSTYKTVEFAGIMRVESAPTAPQGYKFLGWKNEIDGNVYKAGDEYNVTAHTTFTAQWEKVSGGNVGDDLGVIRYTLTFETNGGTPVEAVTKVKNTTVDLSKYITTKSGYRFDGWYTDQELIHMVAEVELTENITVYAKWVVGEASNPSKPNYKPDIFSDEHYSYIVGRAGGYFYPDAYMTRAESAEMLYRLLDSVVRTEAQTAENAFTDVNAGDWFNISVSTLANLGVIHGKTPEIFAPNDKITRAEFTTMMVRLSEIDYGGEDLFTDIATHWAREYTNRAASVGWVNGHDGCFRPEDSITRAEVVTLVNRVLNRQPESKNDLLDNMITPPDNTNENTWYYLAVQEAVNSHGYELKADGIHEKWTSLTETPDWVNLND